MIVEIGEYLEYCLWFMLWLNVAKSIFLGSEFNFVYWKRYGKQYTEWYFKREKFEQYLYKTKEDV